MNSKMHTLILKSVTQLKRSVTSFTYFEKKNECCNITLHIEHLHIFSIKQILKRNQLK